MNTQQKDRIVSSIATLQCMLRYRRHLYANVNDHVHVLSNCILMMTEQLHQNYMYKIHDQSLYNELMALLESISEEFLGIKDELEGRRGIHLTTGAYIDIQRKLCRVHTGLRGIYHRQGSKTLNDILQLEFRIDVYTIPKSTFMGWWIHFLNATFVPLTFDVYKVRGNGEITLQQNYNRGVADDGKKSDSTPSNAACDDAWDCQNISNILESLLAGNMCKCCYPLMVDRDWGQTDGDSNKNAGAMTTTLAASTTPSLIEHLNGARVYVPLERDTTRAKYRCVVAMNGIFRTDCFHIMQTHDHLRTKYKELRVLIDTNATISTTFGKRWVEQLSLRDVMVYDVHDLNTRCLRAYQRLQRLKSRTIANMVKDFLSTPLTEQLEILTLFLLTEEDSDTQYLAYLMYDMISQESYLLKPQPLAEEIYNNLHWTIKKRFRVVIENVGHYTRKLSTDFTENDINYESRIYLMKCSDSVKKRAYDKLKEIQAKSGNENAHKAQQYLDGILRIPFGIYRREKIFAFLGHFREVFVQYCHQCYHATDSIQPSMQTTDIQHLRARHEEMLQMPLVTAHHIERFMSTVSQCLHTVASSPNPLELMTYAQLSKAIRRIKSVLKVRTLAYYREDAAGKPKRHVLRLKCRSSDGAMVPVDTPHIVRSLVEFCRGLTKEGDKHKVVACFSATQGAALQACACEAPSADLEEESSPVAPSLTEMTLMKNHHLRPCIQRFESLFQQWQNFTVDTKAYMKEVEKTLDASVYGHTQAKSAIKGVIAQWVTGELKGYTFGFEGPPGTGKTSLATNGLANCLKDEDGNTRPFAFIGLGGSCNGSTLEGHSYTYVGSTWGRVVDVLMESGVLNPIIYIDELDKVSKTEHGREIIGILTHLTDSTANDEIQDRYFAGIKLDLSKALFVFSYNDPDAIDPILRDRIHRIKFNPLKQSEKKQVCRLHIIPEIMRTIGLSSADIEIGDDIIDFIIDNYTCEGGARRLKEKLFEICREINMRNLIEPERYPVPFRVTRAFLTNDLFAEHAIVQPKRILESPRIGLTNGLYASTAGVGGITIIECFRIPTSSFMALELTGQQGQIMQESMRVAKTVAWNLLSSDTRGMLHKKGVVKKGGPKKGAKKEDAVAFGGLHVHVPDGGTPKDGPSAGVAITISIVSTLLGLPVANTVAITGEIDLNGTVCQIGGLETKLRGAKKAGVKLALFPATNAHDLVAIEKHESPFDDSFRYQMVHTIWDVLPIVFPDVSYPFVKFTVG